MNKEEMFQYMIVMEKSFLMGIKFNQRENENKE